MQRRRWVVVEQLVGRVVVVVVSGEWSCQSVRVSKTASRLSQASGKDTRSIWGVSRLALGSTSTAPWLSTTHNNTYLPYVPR